MSSQLYSNSIFWIDTDKIFPNPYQPRREFNEAALKELSESIRQYGVLQPITVSRIEREKPDGGIVTEYELIAGERRLRASKLAGLSQIPAVIRIGDDNTMKLELAIIENLQREDLNAVDRARAFMRLSDEFGFTHAQIGQKVGKSREYVSNSLRLLTLPQIILDALSAGQISEGHTRPLMMLGDKPEEQQTLFKEVIHKKITVREAERIARHIAVDKVRKKDVRTDPEILALETQLRDVLGTRVHIENREVGGGKIMIDFFSKDDLENLISMIQNEDRTVRGYSNEDYIARLEQAIPLQTNQTSSSFEGNADNTQPIPLVVDQIFGSHADLKTQDSLDLFVNTIPASDTPPQYISDSIPAVIQAKESYSLPVHEVAVNTIPEIFPLEIPAHIENPEIVPEVQPVEIENKSSSDILRDFMRIESEISAPIEKESYMPHTPEMPQNLSYALSDIIKDAENDLNTNIDLLDDRSEQEIRTEDDIDQPDLYSVRSFEI
jgi:ParB family transcriptional regulator, chromosome partitioning protein